MIDVDPTTLGLEFGGGAVIGGLIGFAAKKLAKTLAIIVGVQLMAFRYLESQGILIVDWDRLSAGLVGTQEQAANAAAAEIHWLESILSVVSIGAGFTSGFLVGYHRG